MKILKREQRSLFGEILNWMLTPLLLLWPATFVLTWLVAQGIANKPFDRALEYNVQALAGQLATAAGRTTLQLPVREKLVADDVDQIFYQVLGSSGEWIAGEKDFPAPQDEDKGVSGSVRLRDDYMRNQEVRVAYAYFRPDGRANNRATMVQVAETRSKRSRLASEIIRGMMLPQFVVMPLAVLLVWFALVRGIQPLSQLEQRIRERKPEDMSELDQKAVPTEVQPLVSSINDLLARQKQVIATQKRFLTDAAHQLKTPLAGLRMQADMALRAGTSEADLKQSLMQVSRSSVRATHMVNQLLALARTEASGQSVHNQNCNMAKIAIDVVQECLPRALDKRMDLGYEGVEAGTNTAMVLGNPTLLGEMIRNLVDNAINYTPSTPQRPGVITVRVLADHFSKVVAVQVEDNGPGIARAERELVLQPFYRTLGVDADGSGLGLAIVAEVVQQHAASLSMEDADPKAPAMPGVRFTVRLQRAATA